jgi:hypothetical protein
MAANRPAGASPVFVFIAVLAAIVGGLGCAARGDETLAERKARLAEMDDQEREQLSLNYDRFLHLEPAERDRLQRLYRDLEADADGAELRRVMQHYHDWLNELPATQRTTLAALAPEERLKRIEEIRSSQSRAARLSPADLQTIERWAREHDFRKRWQEARANKTPIEFQPEEVSELRSSLSEEARKALDNADEPVERRGLLRAWLGQAQRQAMSGGGRPGFRRPSDEDMKNFLKNELSAEKRAELLALPPEQMHREQLQLWRERHGRAGEGRRRDQGDKSSPASEKSSVPSDAAGAE